MELDDLTSRFPELIFDGEQYLHGKSLPEISGSSRNQGKGKSIQLACNYMIYDIYVPAAPDLPYADRISRYLDIGAGSAGRYTYIRFVGGAICENWLDVQGRYELALEQGYEGLMLKDASAPYDPGYGGYHSSAMCKMKERHSAEFKVVGWSPGVGKLANCVATWTVAIVPETTTGNDAVDSVLRDSVGKHFKVSIGAPETTKASWWKQFTSSDGVFRRDYYGQLATVEFFEVSPYGIPSQGVWIAFRDYEGRSSWTGDGKLEAIVTLQEDE